MLGGCAPGGVRPEPAPAPDVRAETFFNAGDYISAANEYLQLAQSYPEESITYQLRAADAYIQLNDIDKANSIINYLDLERIDEPLLFHRAILLAKIAVSQHHADRALSVLDIAVPNNIDRELIASLHDTRAKAFELQAKFSDAIGERINLGNYLNDKDQIRMNTGRIWSYLAAMAPAELAKLKNSRIENIGPWIELSTISKTLMSNKEELKTAIAVWSNNYPQHPANPLISSQLLTASERFQVLPKQIALLLPLTGAYGRYSERIRDGFISAWLTEKSYKPLLKIYNTDSLNIAEIYQQAIDEGADFVVGPLEKDAVKILAEMENIPVKTLALNQIDYSEIRPVTSHVSLFSPDLIQYGLPPEDEARQVAQRGIVEGYNNVLVITSADDYGDRIFNAFSNEWTSLGGRILERVDYNPFTVDFITPVKQLLNIDSSEARITALRRQLGRSSMSVSSRLREDADFIFMVASNLTARQIVPHLRFFRVDSIPIYTISYVYTGQPNPQIDNDLNGVEFVDMPWLINPENDRSALNSQIRASWQAASTTFPRYYAFGIDAFRLIQHLGQLSLDRTYKYHGETGDLYMAGMGVIHRNLRWARFTNGEPRPSLSRNRP